MENSPGKGYQILSIKLISFIVFFSAPLIMKFRQGCECQAAFPSMRKNILRDPQQPQGQHKSLLLVCYEPPRQTQEEKSWSWHRVWQAGTGLSNWNPWTSLIASFAAPENSSLPTGLQSGPADSCSQGI